MPGIKGIYIYNEQGEVIGATGGKLAALKNKKNNPDFYKNIGKIGGTRSSEGGFRHMQQHNPEAHKLASAKGGSISRRRKQNESK